MRIVLILVLVVSLCSGCTTIPKKVIPDSVGFYYETTPKDVEETQWGTLKIGVRADWKLK